MKKRKALNNKIILIPLLLIAVFSFAFMEAEKSDRGSKGLMKPANKVGDSYRMFINNIDMPLNREGVIADVTTGGRAYGRIDGKTFLYSGGFFLSGLHDGKVWANAVASASRIQDYIPGTVESGRNDSRAQLYVLRVTDGDFAQSWLDWKDAVALGAYFYDGDGDGIYNPVDKNGNGKWDIDEDKPDLIGDETAWCVFNDGTDPALRRFNDVEPKGIEVRQTLFGFNSKGVVGNMLFLRYSLLNTGTVAEVLDSIYFGVWADPDLGDAYDDLVGCDVSLDAGFVYNDGDDTDFGVNPPTFLIDFFQGPVAYIPGETFTDVNGNDVYDEGVDTPLDTAYNVQGQVRGIKAYPGAKNLGLSSFVHYMQSHPTLGDPNTRLEARNYMSGLDRVGGKLDPCTWAFGTVFGGVNCAQIDDRFWYSGDPVAQIGWINNNPTDQRQMSNTGPFKLEKGKPVDIVVAYVVGRGTNALNSISLAKRFSEVAQFVFDANFPSPPPPPPVEYSVKTGSNFINITWPTEKQVNYRAVDTVLDIDRRFQGYYVTAFRTNTKLPSISGVENAKEIAHYQLDNFINNVYSIVPNGGQDLVRAEATASNKLAQAVYSNSNEGRIRLTISRDPFTDGPLIKGKEYYFAITTYTLNHKVIFNRETNTYGPAGDYLDKSGGGFEEYETSIIRVVFGEDLFDPAYAPLTGLQETGYSSGAVKYLAVNKSELTGENYSVEFFKDSSSKAYSTFWKLKNTSKGTTLIDSSTVYSFDTTNYSGKVTEGFVLRIKPVTPAFGTPKYESAKPVWYTTFSSAGGTGVFYVGEDIPQGSVVKMQNNESARSKAITADRLKKIELRFGTPGKAYRYLNGFVGTVLTRRTTFVYAEGVTAADTGGAKGSLGMFGQGFVDVPFTAWVVDEKYKEEKQLAVGFIELSSTLRGNPDGQWDPGTAIQNSGEYIVIFDAPYDPNSQHKEYTGGEFGTSKVWADIIKGFTIPAGAAGITEVQRKTASSPWFNALYVVGLQRKDSTQFYANGDKLTVPITTYPYTSADKFTFKTVKAGALSQTVKEDLFNKVNVFPNPLFAFNPATSFANANPDEPFVTFSNLPEEVTIKIYTLSGILVRTLTTDDKSTPTSPFIRWNLLNEDELRVASGMYLAIVTAKEFGEKILKFAVIMPQKQIQRF